VPLLGYAPETIFLKGGWLGFHCRNPEDATLLLSSFWVYDGSSLMLKRWRLAFNPETDFFQLRHLWVLLPGLPLHLWNEEAFKAIGNALGKFISLDPRSMDSPLRKVGKVLVELDTSTGLPETLEISWRGRKLQQPLDYLGIPFRCNICRETGHLRCSCPGKTTLFHSEERDLLLNPSDNMDPDPSLDFSEVPPIPVSCTTIGQTDPSLRKVIQSCLSLYSTLTETEKDTFHNFTWINRVTDLGKEPPHQAPDSFPQTLAAQSQTLPFNKQPNSAHSIIDPDAPPLVPPGIGQSQDLDPNHIELSAIMTTPPHLQELESHLDIYRGKELIISNVEAACPSSRGLDKTEKPIAWSRGIGTNLSPLQTRSSKKQKELWTTVQNDPELMIQEGKALRAAKALARSK
jgi:hypothetical protein